MVNHIALENSFGAHNYHPLPVVITEGEGAWVKDVAGKRYLDLLSAYSALNFGHRHPKLIEAAIRQLGRLTLTSRAFHNDQLGPFCAELAELCGMEAVLPSGSGAEAVETAVKLARKWGYQVKGVPRDQANIVVCDGNFHGRTTTIVSFSTDDTARADYGPYTPGFRVVPYGNVDPNAEAMAAAIDENTVAVLVEPVQGEAGVILPAAGWLRRVRELCTANNVLFIADEIQSGLCRTGLTFACQHENVQPDVYILGKALAGGIVPLSATVTRREIMDVFQPGQHGSTFGGNPLACAVGREVVGMLQTGEWQQRAKTVGEHLANRVESLPSAFVAEARVHGPWAGIELTDRAPSGREVCERLLERGVLAKETHVNTVRLAPPLMITEAELDQAVDALANALTTE